MHNREKMQDLADSYDQLHQSERSIQQATNAQERQAANDRYIESVRQLSDAEMAILDSMQADKDLYDRFNHG